MAQLAIDMDQNGPEHPLQAEDAFLMAATPDAQAIKLWHCLYITLPCIVYLGLQ